MIHLLECIDQETTKERMQGSSGGAWVTGVRTGGITIWSETLYWAQRCQINGSYIAGVSKTVRFNSGLITHDFAKVMSINSILRYLQ